MPDQKTTIVLIDDPEEGVCEERGWVSNDVPEDKARDLLAEWCADDDGRTPARPVGPASRVWLAPGDETLPQDEWSWHPCAPGEGVEFWEFDATDVGEVAHGA